MMWPVTRRALLGLAVAGMAVALPSAVAADVGGGCTLSATSTSGGPIDLTAASVWHVKSTDRLSGSGTAPSAQYHADVDALLLGLAIPIATGAQDGGAMHADSTEYAVSDFAVLGRVFQIAGDSTGAHQGCSGSVQVVIDDVNPLLTALGGGGAAGAVVGLLGLVWAVRRPTSSWRTLLALPFTGLIGAGGSLVLQQTSDPGIAPAAGFARSAFVDAVAGPAQVSLDPAILIQSVALTLLVVVLLPFPSELFNRTLEENIEEIRAAIRRVPLLGRLVQEGRGKDPAGPGAGGAARLLGIAAFVLVAGLLYGLLDPGFGPDARSFVTYAGIVLALVSVTWAAALPIRAVHRSAGDRGHLHAVTGTLVIAAACVLISRLAGFLPGYLYGLILGYAFARQLDVAEDGRAHALSAWWMLGLAFVAWLTLGAVRGLDIEGSVPVAVAESVLAALVVAGIEGIVFGLVPLRFMKGEPIFRWRRWRWAVLYAIGVLGFISILVNPTTGFLAPARQTSVFTAVALFVGFGLVSVLFWGYFRFRRRTAAEP
jgi:hypothetical protein